MFEGVFCFCHLVQLCRDFVGRIWYIIDIILWKWCQVLFEQMIAERPKWLSVITGNIKENKQKGMNYIQAWDKKVMPICRTVCQDEMHLMALQFSRTGDFSYTG